MYVILLGSVKGNKRTYLGRNQPVMSKGSALKFGNIESAQERITFWQGLCDRDSTLCRELFYGAEVIEK